MLARRTWATYIYLYLFIYLSIYIYIERERETERDRDTERDRERQRERQRETERDAINENIEFLDQLQMGLRQSSQLKEVTLSPKLNLNKSNMLKISFIF